MTCHFYSISGSVFPINEDCGPNEDLIYKTHKCCGYRCDKLRRGVTSIVDSVLLDKGMPGWPESTWSLNGHTFGHIDDLSNGALTELVGHYGEYEWRRIHLHATAIDRLRTVGESMEEGHLKSFINILVQNADLALQNHGKKAVITNS